MLALSALPLRGILVPSRSCSRYLARGYSKTILTPGGATTKPKSTSDSLKRFIVDKIRSTGPITVAEYMKTAISAPLVGYYGGFSNKQQVFGNRGDFITAPELTQMFGEMIGIWCYYELANTGYSGDWQLVECGPGTGQLMSDLLAVLDKFQEKNVSIHLVETSDALIEQQERLLCVGNSTAPVIGSAPYVKKNKSKSGFPVYWYKNLDDVPEGFSVFVANEFLDALPVHQFNRDSDGKWHEIYVNIDKDMELCFMNSKGENLHTRGLLKESIREDETRTTWEMSPEAGTYVNQIAERITHNGGFGLMVDYGHDGSRKDLSFRAYSKHEQVHPLSNPGSIDLTADVDFGHLKSLIDDRTLVFGPNTQREFLAQLGIEMRLRRLLKLCKDREKQEHLIKSYNYLMGDMGERFHAMAVFPRTLEGILAKRGGPSGFATSSPQSAAQPETSTQEGQDQKVTEEWRDLRQ